MPCVLQDWVCDLTFMQQSVLIAAVRGPDGLPKNHISKKLQRWLRRCILLSAFDRKALTNPYDKGGGSFTGPSCPEPSGTEDKDRVEVIWEDHMNNVVHDYIRTLDAVPHHFQLHFMHAAEILGYKHPDDRIRIWWYGVYINLVVDMHLRPEPEHEMDRRLGDQWAEWRASEVVIAD